MNRKDEPGALGSMRPTAVLLTAVLVLALTPGPALAVPPGNDDFDAPAMVGSLPFNATQDTFEATASEDDPICVVSEATVWYAFTPTEDMRLTANTFGSDYDTTLSAYTGTRGALSQVACNDDAAGDLQSKIAFDAVAGTTYRFMIASYDVGGSLDLSIERARVATRLRLNASKQRVYKNESVRITAHLDAYQDAIERDVSLYATPMGGSRRLVRTGAIDAAGDLTVTVTLSKTTTFVAEWAGDERYLPADSNKVRVYFGVKSGLWLGDTAQRLSWIEFRIENSTKVPRFNIVFYIDYENCPGRARVDWTVKFETPVQIHDDKLSFGWYAPGLSRGVVKGTFTSRSRIKGTFKASFTAPDTGCRGSTGEKGWHASTF